MTRRLVRFAVAALAVAPAAVHSQEPSGSAAFELPAGTAQCAGRLEEARYAADVNPAVPPLLGELCADLTAALSDSVLGETLALRRPQELTPEMFEQLVDLVGRYGGGTASRAAPDAADLAAIVSELQPFEPLPELSLWDRFTQWLQEWLGWDDDAQGDSRFLEWLREFSIPEQWVTVIFYVLGALVVVLALAVLVNELRHGGLFGRQSRRARHYGDAGGGDFEPDLPLTLEDVRRAPAGRQPVLLLAMILERLRLRHSGLFPDSLTHRELIAAAADLGAVRRASFAAVVDAAERVTYASWKPRAADLEPVLSQGETLLHDLPSEEDVPA